jgi:hypothetical protein
MKLQDPLLNLVSRCQTICVAECCGIDAYDFSPVHIASYLILWEGKPNESNLEELRAQLETLKLNYGSKGASSHGATIDDMNQRFSGIEIDNLVDEITENLEIALQICEHAEAARFRSTEQTR